MLRPPATTTWTYHDLWNNVLMLRSATFEPTNEVPAASAFLSGFYRSYYSWIPSRAEGSHFIQPVLMSIWVPDWLDTSFHQKACGLSRLYTGTWSRVLPTGSCAVLHSLAVTFFTPLPILRLSLNSRVRDSVGIQSQDFKFLLSVTQSNFDLLAYIF